MATKEIVTFVDDVTGVASDDVTTIQFGLDGVTYDIDLNTENATRLREALAEFVPHARRVGGRLRRSVKPTATNTDAAAVRVWAEENGFELSGRGRIPNNVLAAYKEAQAVAAPAPNSKARQGRNRMRSRENLPAAPAFTGNDQQTRTTTRRSRTTTTKRTKS